MIEIFKLIFGKNVPCYTFAEQDLCAEESAAFKKLFRERAI